MLSSPCAQQRPTTLCVERRGRVYGMELLSSTSQLGLSHRSAHLTFIKASHALSNFNIVDIYAQTQSVRNHD